MKTYKELTNFELEEICRLIDKSDDHLLTDFYVLVRNDMDLVYVSCYVNSDNDKVLGLCSFLFNDKTGDITIVATDNSRKPVSNIWKVVKKLQEIGVDYD